MNVLMICQYFPPENKIGAVRPSRIAKYLNRYEDVKVSVLTVEPLELKPDELMNEYCGAKVFRASVPRFVKKMNGFLKKKSGVSSSPAAAKENAAAPSSGRGGFKRRLRGFLFNAREGMLERGYLSGAKKILKKIDTPVDAVISTYNTEFGHKVGLWYKKKHPDVKWITDYRDPLCGAYSTPEQKKHGTDFVQSVSRLCDAVTVVTKGISEIHSNDFADKPIYVIPNGYDPEDTVPIDAVNAGMPVRFVYTGELYNGKRDLTPLFAALSELESQSKISFEDIEVLYAGKSGGIFASQIDRFPGIKHTDLGFISRQEALNLQSGADFLLLSSWCEPQDKEVLTGKFFEYLQMKKPIICMISGSASDCALTRIINGHSLGCSYEAASGETDHRLLCDYLEKQITAKKNHGKVDFTGDDEFVEQFSYKRIADEFYKVLN